MAVTKRSRRVETRPCPIHIAGKMPGMPVTASRRPSPAQLTHPSGACASGLWWPISDVLPRPRLDLMSVDNCFPPRGSTVEAKLLAASRPGRPPGGAGCTDGPRPEISRQISTLLTSRKRTAQAEAQFGGRRRLIAGYSPRRMRESPLAWKAMVPQASSPPDIPSVTNRPAAPATATPENPENWRTSCPCSTSPHGSEPGEGGGQAWPPPAPS